MKKGSYHCLSRKVKSSRVSAVNSQEQSTVPGKKLGELSGRK